MLSISNRLEKQVIMILFNKVSENYFEKYFIIQSLVVTFDLIIVFDWIKIMIKDIEPLNNLINMK